MIELNFPNPVSTEKDADGRRIFFGRRSEMGRIEHTVLSGTRRPVIVLGERRSGKTSLQRVSAGRLTERVEDRLLALFIEPQGINSRDQLAKEILERLCSALGTSLREIGLVEPIESVSQFVDAVARLIKLESDKMILVCVDEFETILNRSTGQERDKILGLVTYVIEKVDLPLTLFFTMTGLTTSIQESYPSPFASVAEIIRLRPFDQETLQEMVTELLRGQVVLPEAEMERLFYLSGGHPYFTKLLLAKLLERYPPIEGKELTVSDHMLTQAVKDAGYDSRADIAIKNIYQVHLSEGEQRIALLLAERGDHGRLTAQELETLGTPLKTAARRLAQRDYLREKDGSFGFRIGFLGYWLQHWIEFEEEQERLELDAIWGRMERQRDPPDADRVG